MPSVPTPPSDPHTSQSDAGAQRPNATAHEPATAILARTQGMSQMAREREFVALIQRGNVPLSTWDMVPIRYGLSAMADFLAVGTDGDFMWVPLTPMAAMEVLAPRGMRLPHRDEADAIFAAARAQSGFVPFQAFSPMHGQTRWGNTAIASTRQRLEVERAGRKGLLDGHKKYVLGHAVVNGEGRVIIYGGHTYDGASVQPYSTVHADSYLDYSHGIRGVRV